MRYIGNIFGMHYDIENESESAFETLLEDELNLHLLPESEHNTSLEKVIQKSLKRVVKQTLGINALDIYYQGNVLDVIDDPPAHVDGERYIINSNPTGDWVGKNNQIAESDGYDWSYIEPTAGMRVYIEDESALYQFITEWEIWENQALATTSSVIFNKVTTPDDDTSHFFGRAYIGYGGGGKPAHAFFGHRAIKGSNSYAIKQSSAGRTFINCVDGDSILFRSNNVNIGSININGFFLQAGERIKEFISAIVDRSTNQVPTERGVKDYVDAKDHDHATPIATHTALPDAHRTMLDEDDLVSNDDTKTASQQSIKTYADAEYAALQEYVDGGAGLERTYHILISPANWNVEFGEGWEGYNRIKWNANGYMMKEVDSDKCDQVTMDISSHIPCPDGKTVTITNLRIRLAQKGGGSGDNLYIRAKNSENEDTASYVLNHNIGMFNTGWTPYGTQQNTIEVSNGTGNFNQVWLESNPASGLTQYGAVKVTYTIT